MDVVQCFVERILRPFVRTKCWDYIVLWKLRNDNRFIEWMECCCAGNDQNIDNGGGDIVFDSSSGLRCRDIMLPHPRTKPCDLLDQLPTSIILDSGVHAQTLLLNQACWINYTHNSDSSLSEETIGTRVLVPVPLGLVELFVTKQVPEDQNVIDFIKSQCINFSLEQQSMSHSATVANSFSPDRNFQHEIDSSSKENKDLHQDISAGRINLCTPLQQFGNTNNSNFTANDSGIFTPSIQNGFQKSETLSDMSRASGWAADDKLNDESFICENNMRSDESDLNEDEDDAKYRRRMGKGPRSKNLMAERKRRKKLNDRLYSLRALVPNISKLHRAAILGDAIEYVNELKKQMEDLKAELQEHSENEDTSNIGNEDTDHNNVIQPSPVTHQNGRHKRENAKFVNGCQNRTVHNQEELDCKTDKVQQMEPQVEVFKINGNEFFVKIFCEHTRGGFVRMMEALNSLGLEVTNVNTTRHTCLVSSIFKVEPKNDETVQANDVKESLLELTRNPSTNNCPNIQLSHNTIGDTHPDYGIHQPYSFQHDY